VTLYLVTTGIFEWTELKIALQESFLSIATI